MENILAMVEGPSSSEISNINQIDQNLLEEFLAKSSVWDFYEMTKKEYSSKGSDQKQVLIIRYYNEVVKGKIYIFASFLLSGLCLVLPELSCIIIWMFNY